MGPFDRAYKLLFSCIEVVLELLQFFFLEVCGKVVSVRVLHRGGEAYVSQEGERSRVADLVWVFEVAGCRGALVLEFARTVERLMVGRLMEYAVLAWRHVERELLGRRLRRVPVAPVVVIYNGERPWTVRRSTVEGLPRWLHRVGVQLWYLVLDVRRIPLERLSRFPLLSFMVRIERAADPVTAARLLRELGEYLRARRLKHLERPFACFSALVWFWGEFPMEELLAMSTLHQVNTRLQRMMQRAREEARREALEEGERRGERRALRSALVAVLEARFGAVPEWARERIDAGSVEQLDCWVRRAATAISVEAVFGDD